MDNKMKTKLERKRLSKVSNDIENRIPENGKPVEGIDTDYDPYLHRQILNPTTNMESLGHLLKGVLGTGILAAPQAFHFAGYTVGVISTIIIGFICAYCMHTLVKSQYLLCKKHQIPLLTYSLSMKMALAEGPHCLRFLSTYAGFESIHFPCTEKRLHFVIFISNSAIVDGFLIFYQIGLCCVYLVFVAENVKQIVDYYWIDLDIKIHMAILLLPMILIVSIKNLKFLAPFSIFANITMCVGLGILLYYIFDDMSPPSNRNAMGLLKNYPLFFGTTLVSLTSVAVVMTVEANMKTPASFGGYFGVYNLSVIFIIVVYTIIGFFGFLKYDDECEASITLNLPQGDILAQSVKILVAIGIFISLGLQGYVPASIIWGTYLCKRYEKSTHTILYEFLIRIGIATIAFLLSVAIPRLGLFISLLGALCLSVLAIGFPAIIEICVLYSIEKLTILILLKNCFLILFGITGLIIGTYVSIRDIVLSFT